ncbi:MAG: hypothetical protein U1D30_05095 [Planctomycetota bacterium]
MKAEAFAIGANDYLVKLPDKLELLAPRSGTTPVATFIFWNVTKRSPLGLEHSA